jgi:hypothetical protein
VYKNLQSCRPEQLSEVLRSEHATFRPSQPTDRLEADTTKLCMCMCMRLSILRPASLHPQYLTASTYVRFTRCCAGNEYEG